MIRNKSFGDIDVSKAAAALGRKGGAAKSPAKARTAAENGKLGGRPLTTELVVRLHGPNDRRDEASGIGSLLVRQADALKAAKAIDEMGMAGLEGLRYEWKIAPKSSEWKIYGGHGVMIKYPSGKSRIVYHD